MQLSYLQNCNFGMGQMAFSSQDETVHKTRKISIPTDYQVCICFIQWHYHIMQCKEMVTINEQGFMPQTAGANSKLQCWTFIRCWGQPSEVYGYKHQISNCYSINLCVSLFIKHRLLITFINSWCLQCFVKRIKNFIFLINISINACNTWITWGCMK